MGMQYGQGLYSTFRRGGRLDCVLSSVRYSVSLLLQLAARAPVCIICTILRRPTSVALHMSADPWPGFSQGFRVGGLQKKTVLRSTHGVGN